MIKSKVFEVLQSLSKDDLKRFNDYLCSPFFNKREVLCKLFNVYKKFHPRFDDKNLTKERVFKKIFPDKKYNDEIFRNLNSILLKHSEDFFSLINYLKDPFTVKKHLLSEISNRNVLAIFEKNFEEGKKILEGSEQRDLRYFLNEYNLFSEKDIYNSFINKFSKEDIIQAEKSFWKFFIMKILETQNYILYECRILGLDNSLFLKNNFVNELLKKIPAEITQMPQIQIYYNALMLEQTQKEKYYNKLKFLLDKYGRFIEKERHYTKYIYMIDYIKRTRPTNDIETTFEIFQLRKKIVENGLMVENFMTNMFFLNLVKSGLKLKEYEWVYNFIHNYNHMLIPKYRESTADLSLALLYFEKREFGESLSHAAKVKYEDNFYNLEVKNLTARIYYEKNQFDLYTNFISSYRMYLSKNRTLGKKDFTSHRFFINSLDKLIRIREQQKIYKVDNLISQINKLDFVNKAWIFEKAKELQNGYHKCV